MLAMHPQEMQRAARHRLHVELATSAEDIDAAQHLRYQVFVDELGARIGNPSAERDRDCFDPWCEHLVVRDEASNAIVGTYRILTAERARRIGSFYSETEFDLTRLKRLRSGICETGRACIHPSYRTGPTIMLLWQGIAALMRERGCHYLIGCASISMADGGADAVQVWRNTTATHLAPIEYRVFPRHPLLVREEAATSATAVPRAVRTPALLRAYLRIGAWIGGEPAWDPDFNTADLFVFLPLARVEARYARHYLKAASAVPRRDPR